MGNKRAVVLRKAREVLSKKGSWIQGTYATTKHGRKVDPTDPKAVRFCALGAVHRVASTRTKSAALDRLERTVGSLGWGMYTAAYNDQIGRTQEEVLDLFDLAIAIQEVGE